MIFILLRRQFLKPLEFKFSNDEKQEVLAGRNTLVRQVQKYINNNLSPANVNVIDPKKVIFVQPPSFKKDLDELEISKEMIITEIFQSQKMEI